MFVLIIGGGKDGVHLTEELMKEKQPLHKHGAHKVVLVEKSPAVYEKLTRDKELQPATLLQGDGCDPIVLENAGIRQADVLAALTCDDEDNLVIAQLGKFEFNVPKIIARVNHPKNEWLFSQDMGVDVAVSKSHIITKIIEEEATLGDLVTLLKLRKGELSLVEETLKDSSKAVNRPIKELNLPKDCILVAVLRGGQILLPNSETVLKSGDEILALTSTKCEPILAEKLG